MEKAKSLENQQSQIGNQNEEEREITLEVTVNHEGDTAVVKEVKVKVLRDTDGDGKVDKDDEPNSDNDDDNDGIDDTTEKANHTDPKAKTGLEVTVTTPANKAIDKQSYESEKVVTTNKPGATISSTEKNGLSVNGEGKVVGKPAITDWQPNEEEREITLEVTVNHEGDTAVVKEVKVKVLKRYRWRWKSR